MDIWCNKSLLSNGDILDNTMLFFHNTTLFTMQYILCAELNWKKKMLPILLVEESDCLTHLLASCYPCVRCLYTTGPVDMGRSYIISGQSIV